MSDKLDKYFAGELSRVEKGEFLKEVGENAELKEEFILTQNLMGLADLSSRKGDKEWGEAKFAEFERQMKRKKMKQYIIAISRYAAVIVIVFLSTWFVSKHYFLDPLKNAYAEVEVPQGHRAQVRLDDGTTVWLNSRSRLRYPNAFVGDKRIVELDGEGYFNVQKNKDKPFIVKTSRYDVQVLGTKFNVFNYSESPIFETTLLEGSVRVFKSDNDKDFVHLQPNEQLVMKNGKLEKKELEKQDVSLWESAYFMFDGEPLETIIGKLALYYNVKFIVRNEKALQTNYTGNFSSDDSIKDILDAIQNVQKFSFTMSSDKKIVYIN